MKFKNKDLVAAKEYIEKTCSTVNECLYKCTGDCVYTIIPVWSTNEEYRKISENVKEKLDKEEIEVVFILNYETAKSKRYKESMPPRWAKMSQYIFNVKRNQLSLALYILSKSYSMIESIHGNSTNNEAILFGDNEIILELAECSREETL